MDATPLRSSPQPVIVVGVDGTPGSAAALAFALGEALTRGAAIEVVTAWLSSVPSEGLEGVGRLDEAWAAATAVQDVLVEQAVVGLTERPDLTQIVVNDFAGKVLVKRAADALMLVVGSGRRKALAHTSLGSVSEYCIHAAASPVVVVPDPERLARRVPRPARREPVGLGASG